MRKWHLLPILVIASIIVLPVSIKCQPVFAQTDTSQGDTLQSQDTTKSDTTLQDTSSSDSSGMNGSSSSPPAIFEAGVIIGEPSGLSAKYWLTSKSAFDAAVAWSFSNSGHFNVYADYLFHPYYIPSEFGDFPTFFGIGVTLQVRPNNSFFGARIPLGVELLWNQIPLAIFAQVAPIMEIVPDMAFRIDGGVGIRFAFGRESTQGF